MCACEGKGRRKKILSRHPTDRRALRGYHLRAQEIMTLAETKSQALYQLSQAPHHHILF